MLVGLLSDSESLMANFFWHQDNSRKIHWLAWRKLCVSKGEGGLGFRIQEFNQALLCKQAWRRVTNQHSLLSRMLRARYFAQGSFFEAGGGVRPPYGWRPLLCAALARDGTAVVHWKWEQRLYRSRSMDP
ncbi:UNVERIFIED_CONTAM: putative mitochondrial protein [Sesamum latifolium]|uniref:Mitochondrial protein n=1 Tax=Sesamum latifolium TaxID=2727402 RepID=A0AAW2TL28_9LAMI